MTDRQDKVIFRDLEKQYGFAQISHLITEDRLLSDLAVRVYLALLKYAMNKNYCFPGQDKLAETIGKSRSSIFRGLNELKNRRLVSSKTRGLNKTNLYILEPISEIYAEKLGILADVSDLQQQDVSELTHQDESNLTYKEYKVEEEKIIKNRITKIKTRMKNAEDGRMDRIVTSDEFTDIYTRLKDELSVAMSDLSSIQNDHTDKVKILNDLLSLSENIYTSYIRADSILKRKYLRMFFDGIYVDNKEIVHVEYNPVIAQLTKIREVRITNNWR